MLFAGKMNQAHLNGLGLATTLYNVVVTAISCGYSSVFDTYGPQVYGSENPGELGTVLQACLLQGFLVNLVVMGPFLNAVYLIDLLPESTSSDSNGLPFEKASVTDIEDFGDIAVKYLRIIAFVEYLDYSLLMISGYFAIQGYNKFVYLVSMVMLISHILSNYVLVTLLDLDVLGLGLSHLIGRLTALAVSLTICCVMVRKGRFSWNGFSTKALLGWTPMLKLGIFGSVCTLTAIGLLEIASFLCQFDGADALSVFIIMEQYYMIHWAVYQGMSRAAATLIGQSLSEGDPEQTRSYMKLSLVYITVAGVLIAILTFCLRQSEVLLFSSDEGVISLFMDTVWMFCVMIPSYHIQPMMYNGILVAFGAQKFGAFSMFIVYFAVGLPIVCIAVFLTDCEVTGILLGITIANLILIAIGAFWIWKVDVVKEIGNCKQRIEEMSSTGTETTPILEGDKEQNSHLKTIINVSIAFSLAFVVCMSLIGISYIR